jgi:hypothetical protein
MTTKSGDRRRYETLCNVLDALRMEAPSSDVIYHPPKSNADALIQARSRALLHLYLKARFGLLRYEEREKLVTDGSGDGGIDAYFIDRRTKRIHYLQSKFRATAGNFVATNMTATDILKMDVGRILKGEKRDVNGAAYNQKIVNGLQRAIKSISDIASYSQNVVLLGNTKNFSVSQLKKLIEGYPVEQFPHERAYRELLFPVVSGTYYSEPDLIIEINLTNVKGSDSHLDYSVRAGSVKASVKLLFVPTREIGRIMNTYKNSILKFNPRSFLELTGNSVNKEIELSLRNSESNDFALFNNGITIIADQTQISSNTARQDTAQVVLRNPQLVNGAQTAYTLSRIYEECIEESNFKVFRGKEVLLRIITFVGAEKQKNVTDRLKLIGSISRASNSQTKIEESDRRSNDPVQLKLQEEFFSKHGLYYERKRGEFSDGIHQGYLSKSLIVNREKLVRVSLACDYKANQARSSVAKFFKESELPTVMKVKDVSQYAYGYEVLALIEHKKKEKPLVKGDRYHTQQFGEALRYGHLAVVAVCANLGPANDKDEEQVLKTVLQQWQAFETWASNLTTNASYRTGAGFDFVNYYKGSTVNADLQKYAFTV